MKNLLLAGLLLLAIARSGQAGEQGAPYSAYVPPDKDAALTAIKTHALAAQKSGAKCSAWLTVFGAKQKYQIESVDDKNVSIKVGDGNVLIQPWAKLSAEDIGSLAKSMSLENGRWLLAVADYHLANDDAAHAEELLTLAVNADANLGSEMSKRMAFLQKLKAKTTVETLPISQPGLAVKTAPAGQIKAVELVRLPADKVPPPQYADTAGPATQLVIPIGKVLGGTGEENNAKSNPKGGYFSVFNSISEFKYPNTHGNQFGKTAMVNDHCYWDSSPGGLDNTHSPGLDKGAGKALWWPVPTEWAAYVFNVNGADTYTVMTRFSSSWGPGKHVVIHMLIDEVNSGPIELKPDDSKIWSDKRHLVGGWWGHTMTSCSSPVGWTLAPGPHILKVHIDSFPDKPTDHGNLWIHYFKVVKSGTPIGVEQ